MPEQTINPIELASNIAPLQKWEFVNKSNVICELIETRNGVYRVLEITWRPEAEAVYLSMPIYLDMVLEDVARLLLLDLLNIFNNQCSYGSWILDLPESHQQTYTTISWKDEINTDISELTSEGLKTAAVNAFNVFDKFIYGIYAYLENPQDTRREDGARVIGRFTTPIKTSIDLVRYSGMSGHA